MNQNSEKTDDCGLGTGYQNYIDSPCICLKRQCKKKNTGSVFVLVCV